MFKSKPTKVQGKIEEAIEALAEQFVAKRITESGTLIVELSYKHACYLCANGQLSLQIVKRTGEISFYHPDFAVKIVD